MNTIIFMALMASVLILVGLFCLDIAPRFGSLLIAAGFLLGFAAGTIQFLHTLNGNLMEGGNVPGYPVNEPFLQTNLCLPETWKKFVMLFRGKPSCGLLVYGASTDDIHS